MSKELSRRDFLKVSALGAIGMALPPDNNLLKSPGYGCYEIAGFGPLTVNINYQNLYVAISDASNRNHGYIPVDLPQLVTSTQYLFNFDEMYGLYASQGGKEGKEVAYEKVQGKNIYGCFGKYGEVPFVYVDAEAISKSPFVNDWISYEEHLQEVFRNELGHLTQYADNRSMFEHVYPGDGIYYDNYATIAAACGDGLFVGLAAGGVTSAITNKITKNENVSTLVGLGTAAAVGTGAYRAARSNGLTPISASYYLITDASKHDDVDTNLAKNSIAFNNSYC